MRTKSILLGTAAVLVLAAQPATAGHFNGWYVGIEGGASWVDDFDHTLLTTWVAFTPTFAVSDTFFGTHRSRTDFDTGWAVLATVGYGFGGGWRAEFEAGYRDNDGDGFLSFATPVPLLTPFTGFAIVTAPYSVDLQEVTLMANVIYDIPLSERFSLSLGAGAGADYIDVDIDAFGLSGGDNTWQFAWQVMAGLNYEIAPQTAVFLNYRYLQVEDIDDNRFFPALTVFGASFRDAALITDDDLQKHAVTIGLRYDLAPDYVPPPPAPPAPPPPPPPPPAQPKEFIVFFGFDKSNLTAEASAVVQQAAAAYKEGGSANVKVVGHTDRAGSDEYNHALSLRRADAVKSGLVADGVPEGSITVDGRGESEPMVATDDGVREPQNRRVNISL